MKFTGIAFVISRFSKKLRQGVVHRIVFDGLLTWNDLSLPFSENRSLNFSLGIDNLRLFPKDFSENRGDKFIVPCQKEVKNYQHPKPRFSPVSFFT